MKNQWIRKKKRIEIDNFSIKEQMQSKNGNINKEEKQKLIHDNSKNNLDDLNTDKLSV